MLMKKLNSILQFEYRIIEFTNSKSLLREFFPNNCKLLSISKNSANNDNNVFKLNKIDFTHAIEKNSTDIIVLNDSGFRELNALLRTAEAQLCFTKITIFNLFLLPYFLLKGIILKRFKFYGLFSFYRLKRYAFYLGFIRIRQFKRTTRCYLSPNINIEEFFDKLNRKKIKYSILRWFEELNNFDLHEDIDLIVDDHDLNEVHSIIFDQPGIIPFDIYSQSGLPGSDFRSLPYYSSALAEKAINEAVLFNGKYKVPTWENYFYLLSYHAVFHKGENSGLSSKKYKLSPHTTSDHDYLSHLKYILAKTKLEITEFTLEGLHLFLEEKGFAPPIDTQYKLSLQNEYLKECLKDFHKQSDHVKKFEGLVCFVAREKIIELGLLEELKKYIQKEGFTIIKVKELEETVKAQFSIKVRGGNWNQGPWPVNGGYPAILLIAFDVHPVKPESDDFKIHPGLSNRRIKNKSEIRDFINNSLPDKKEWFNGIHSSDNELQAVEYFTLAGVNQEEIYEEIIKVKDSFKTNFPVLKELSNYSKRAKVELILYNDKKAVKKTFKPMCEIYLENEIQAYSILKGIINTPELLEVGTNYIITSYIEDSHTLNKRISVKRLKQCLGMLRKIYELGFSLLDFKPGNFLIDKNGNVYVIDFEFFFKYSIKPDFFECYDLIGIPKSINPLLTPNNHIPDGKKQFDVLWHKYTGLFYDELKHLDSLGISLKSFSRYYILRINKRIFKLKGSIKKIVKFLFKSLP